MAVSDNGQHGTVTQQWSVVSGPSGAVFADSTAANTTVQLPQVGAYVLRFTATNSVGGGHADVPVTVNLAPDAVAGVVAEIQ